MVCYGADVTERVAEERTIRIERAALRGFLDDVPTSVSVFDRDGKFCGWTARGSSRSGSGRGNSWATTCPPLGAEGIITGINPGIAGTIVTQGLDPRDIVVHATLREALKHCITAESAGRGVRPLTRANARRRSCSGGHARPVYSDRQDRARYDESGRTFVCSGDAPSSMLVG